MNILKRHESNPETKGIVLHHTAWVYDLGCYLVGMGARFRRKTLQLAQLQSGEHVLDVGCGSGGGNSHRCNQLNIKVKKALKNPCPQKCPHKRNVAGVRFPFTHF